MNDKFFKKNAWIIENKPGLNDFKDNYCKLGEKCSKAKDYLDMANINVQNFVTFESNYLNCNQIFWLFFFNLIRDIK